MSASKKPATKVAKRASRAVAASDKGPDSSAFIPRSDKVLAEYLDKILVWHGYARFIGLPALIESSKDVPLQRLYVAPHLSESPITPEAMNGKPPPTIQLVPALVEHQKLVVLGDPGSGKSTLVNYISESLARRSKTELWRAIGQDLVPIPFILRELNVGEDVTWESLRDAFLQRPVGMTLGKTLEKREQFFDQLMTSGQGWVMLDGIDEIGSSNVRTALNRAYIEAVQHYPKARFLLTSRVIGYDEVPFHGNPLENMTTEDAIEDWRKILSERLEVDHRLPKRMMTHRLYLAPFDDDQVREFTQNWWAHHRANPAVAAAEANDFLAALHAKQDTRTLGRVPNLLVLIALIYKVFVKLPDGRSDLYAKIVEAYLENIDRHYKLACPLPYNSNQMARWLARVAWEMQMRRHYDALVTDKTTRGLQKKALDILVTREEAQLWITHAISELEGCEESKASELAATFLDYAARRSGLFVPRGEDADGRDMFTFMHLSFQEYFCALHLSSRVSPMSWWKKNVFTQTQESSPFSVDALRSYAVGVEWAEVFVFLFEMLKRGDTERPLALLRVLLGESDEGVDWQELDAPFTDTKRAESMGSSPPVHRRIKDSRLIDLAATLAMNSEVEMPREARQNLLRRCWEWETRRTVVDINCFGSHITRTLLSSRAHLEDSLSQLTAISETVVALDLAWCDGMKDFNWLRSMTHLQILNLASCSEITTLRPLKGLLDLRQLLLRGCIKIDSLEPLKQLTNLETLLLPESTTAEMLSSLNGLHGVKELYMDGCEHLTTLKPIQGMTSLSMLSVSACVNLRDFNALAALTNLKRIYLDECFGLKTLEPLRGLGSLVYINLNGCENLESLEPLRGLAELSRLDLDYCSQLETIEPLQELTRITRLGLRSCYGIKSLKPLQRLVKLDHLDLGHCLQFDTLEDLQPLVDLGWLNFEGCEKIRTLEPLSKLAKLRHLNIKGCTGLESSEIEKFHVRHPKCTVLQ